MYRKIAFMKSRNTFFSIRMRFDPFGSAYIFMQTHIVFEHTIVFISITKVAFAKYWHTTLLCYVYQNRLFNTFRSSSCLTSPCTFIRFRNGEWYSARASITSASCRFRFSFFRRSAFDMQSGFLFHFGKVHAILSLCIDYKLASIALNSHYFRSTASNGLGFWSSRKVMGDKMTSSWVLGLRGKQIPKFREHECWALFDFRTRLICTNKSGKAKSGEKGAWIFVI